VWLWSARREFDSPLPSFKEVKMKNILFICKHNVFRSKVAEAYFKKINKNKQINADGAGLIKTDFLSETEKKLVKFQRKIAKQYGIIIKQSSKPLSIKLLKKQDIIIIVANDVPKEIFNNKFYLKPNLKLITWEIKDVEKGKNNKEIIKTTIPKIMKKVERLIKKLEKEK
tara:strand:+ start:1436 stop:1945 length:510 start_codon:yes stop_codon:yes gene_type:complete